MSHADAAPGPPAPSQKHPRGLYLLSGVEMWERFSYYGMRAILVLFLIDNATGGWGWSKASASRLYAWYTSLVYLGPVLGGYVADRFIGTHRSLIIGGVVIAAGHFCLAMQSPPLFFVGLGLIIIGTGFFKSNVSTMVGQLYRQGDPSRDAGFTIYYMAINVGALLGNQICGYLGETPAWGWHWGFGAAGVGMLLGLAMYVWGKRRFLGAIGDVPMARQAASERHVSPATPVSTEERDRIIAIFIVVFFVIFFWLAYEQAGSSMNIFAKERTERHFFGWEMPASWFQSVNPAVLLLSAPLFAGLWTRLAARGRPISAPFRMAVGLLLLGGGFIFMIIGATLSERGHVAGPFWLTMAYVLHTWGELCVSPVGLSMITRLAPAKFASMLMGVWFLANWAANLIGGYVASIVERVERGEVFHVVGGQADFWLMFVISSTGAGVILLLLTPMLKRLMHGRA